MKLLICFYLLIITPGSIDLFNKDGFHVVLEHQNIAPKVKMTLMPTRKQGDFSIFLYKIEKGKLLLEGKYPFMSDVKSTVGFLKMGGNYLLIIVNTETDEIIGVRAFPSKNKGHQ